MQQERLRIPFDHVTQTAWMTAAFRLWESERADAHFDDRISAKLLEGADDLLKKGRESWKSGSWMMVVRTHEIDRMIEQLANSGKIDAVLNLGTGLDTRPYRLKLPSELRWFEADYKQTIDFKADRLKGDEPVCILERISADLAVASERKAVIARAAEGSRSLLVLTESLLMYLLPEHVENLAKELRACHPCRHWIMDMSKRSFFEWAWKRWGMADQVAKNEGKFTEFTWTPEDPAAFISRFGWRLVEYAPFGKGAIALKRQPEDAEAADLADNGPVNDAGIAHFEASPLDV